MIGMRAPDLSAGRQRICGPGLKSRVTHFTGGQMAGKMHFVDDEGSIRAIGLLKEKIDGT
ncbi:hypothetical protein [Arthrobacter oryzae]|uniref:hypothetical protein n=1 Tax=Arthrobacter oryzae TaxID=409290 RepID=UPI002862B3DF|nr:hypothetical protein [Arthrobacter oryzae]MDR6506893.1 hypothetical protein [Arthrobacter oryzae]